MIYQLPKLIYSFIMVILPNNYSIFLIFMVYYYENILLDYYYGKTEP